MKATTSYKLKLVEQARKNGIAVWVRLRGSDLEYSVLAVRNLQHTTLLTLDRNSGFIAVDPDDITLVRVPKLPPAFEESHSHAY